MIEINQCDLCDSSNVFEIAGSPHLKNCLDCGYVFDSPIPTKQELSDFYSTGGQYSDWLTHVHERERMWNRRRKLINRDFHSGNLLDVGAGIGQFLKTVKDQYREVLGTEVSREAISIAKSKYGLELIEGDLLQLHFESNSFDNITMFHVLEHVQNPSLLLNECYRLLRSGGFLYIAVPNDLSPRFLGLSKSSNQNVRNIPHIDLSKVGGEIHLSHFRPEVLKKALINRNFNIQRQTLDPYFVNSGVRRFRSLFTYYISLLLRRFGIETRFQAYWTVAVKK